MAGCLHTVESVIIHKYTVYVVLNDHMLSRVSNAFLSAVCFHSLANLTSTKIHVCVQAYIAIAKCKCVKCCTVLVQTTSKVKCFSLFVTHSVCFAMNSYVHRCPYTCMCIFWYRGHY